MPAPVIDPDLTSSRRLRLSSAVALTGVGLLSLWAVVEHKTRRVPASVVPSPVAALPLPARPSAAETSPLSSHGADEEGGSPSAVERSAHELAVIRLFGERSVEGPSKTVSSRSFEVWALFGLLAEHRTTLLTRAAAEAKLWPDTRQGQDRFPNLLKEARAKLCDALGIPTSRGRQAIEYVRGTGYRLNAALVTCDVWLFGDAIACPKRGAAALRSAVSAYSGDYLDGIDHGWGVRRRLTLRREAVIALSRLADLEDERLSALAHLERATTIDPAAEHLFQRRMEIYAELGWTQEIHYCFEAISEELRRRGSQVGAHTKELRRQLTGIT